MSNNIEQPFSERLKAARSALGLSQQKLSELTDIPKRTIERWEVGERQPTKWTQRLVLNELERMIDAQSNDK